MSLEHFQDINNSIKHTYEKVLPHSQIRLNPQEQVMYLTIGLTGEAGEVAEKVKKWIRDGWDIKKIRAELTNELGDLFWYMARLASHFNLSLEEIAYANLKKLADRRERGVISGEGDHR